MRKAFLSFSLFLALNAVPALAQDMVTLGHARLFTNDAIGDTDDRWRSGAYSLSFLRGERWGGDLPARPGEILEFRVRAEIIAPANLITPSVNDRRYAGVLGFGLFTHFALGEAEASLGGELVATGPRTHVDDFQAEAHDLFGLRRPKVGNNQISNGIHPTAMGEIGRQFQFGESITLRPFAEAQAGVESFARVGGDIVVGNFGRGALLVRDSVTGHRVKGIEGVEAPGISFTVGGDVAHVFDSVYLPDSGAVQLEETRTRLRAGLHWQGETAEVFYGLTWLGKEFETQPDTQVIGSVRVSFRF